MAAIAAAALPYIMPAIMITSMASTIALSGMDAGKNADKVRTEITSIKNRTASLKAKFDSVINGDAQFNQMLQDSMTTDVDALSQITAQTKVSRDAYLSTIKKIQMTGIIFVVVIFFLLLLKETGVLDAIQDLIISPFNSKNKS
ncbi:MAG: hypothetical protein GY861_04610 [bacterium]|nr:hypothetical protein [bacterium]